jgi:hypothetical protein
LSSPVNTNNDIRTLSHESSEFANFNRKAAIQASFDTYTESFNSTGFHGSKEVDRDSYKSLSDEVTRKSELNKKAKTSKMEN